MFIIFKSIAIHTRGVSSVKDSPVFLVACGLGRGAQFCKINSYERYMFAPDPPHVNGNKIKDNGQEDYIVSSAYRLLNFTYPQLKPNELQQTKTSTLPYASIFTFHTKGSHQGRSMSLLTFVIIIKMPLLYAVKAIIPSHLHLYTQSPYQLTHYICQSLL